PGSIISLSDKLFNRYREKLETRTNTVIGGLGNVGITAVALPTQSLIELFYGSYNPDLSQVQKLPKEEEMKIDA
ncbi:MAG: hypothetical protein U1C18_02690, partial [Patescibacteria group bacterium]|nr:hypothetical protein [Patescibacteria group bacterium]